MNNIENQITLIDDLISKNSKLKNHFIPLKVRYDSAPPEYRMSVLTSTFKNVSEVLTHSSIDEQDYFFDVLSEIQKLKVLLLEQQKTEIETLYNKNEILLKSPTRTLTRKEKEIIEYYRSEISKLLNDSESVILSVEKGCFPWISPSFFEDLLKGFDFDKIELSDYIKKTYSKSYYEAIARLKTLERINK